MSRLKIILVVEDEPLVSMSLAADLSDAGYTVLEAQNADAAIELLEGRDDIALIITDVDMPGSMDGLRLAATVSDRWPPIRIIVVSGHRNVSDNDIPAGSKFWPKPYTTKDIVETMLKMID